jgi:hypothetical protein
MQLSRWSTIVGLIASVGTIALLNYRDLQRYRGDDMFAPHGVPFALYREGGYAGGGGVVWTGAVFDLSVTLSHNHRIRTRLVIATPSTMAHQHQIDLLTNDILQALPMPGANKGGQR